MKGLMLRKVVVASFLIIVSDNISKIACSEVLAKTAPAQSGTEHEIITQAVSEFKNKIQNSDKHLRSISCRFKVHEGKWHEMITKTYSNAYRKKPDYEIKTHLAAVDQQADSVIEVRYLKHSPSLSISYFDGRGKKRLSTKKVDLPIGFSA